jgi:hypothetical protein
MYHSYVQVNFMGLFEQLTCILASLGISKS